jgi:hypothetical protein
VSFAETPNLAPRNSARNQIGFDSGFIDEVVLLWLMTGSKAHGTHVADVVVENVQLPFFFWKTPIVFRIINRALRLWPCETSDSLPAVPERDQHVFGCISNLSRKNDEISKSLSVARYSFTSVSCK